MDAAIGVEDGISRAFAALLRTAEAGYGFSTWEKAAGVLAGWDTDKSPTIQTRFTHVPSAGSRPLRTRQQARLSMRPESLKPEAATLWAVRIKATRTLQEAWTCFLACKDQGIFLTEQIYHLMFEKIIYDNKRGYEVVHNRATIDSGKEEAPIPMPGDGKEVAESSVSHNEAVSTREPLPTFETLFNQMTRDQIRPSGRFLEFLLKHARSYTEGMEILKACDLEHSVKEVMTLWDEIWIMDLTGLLESIPIWLFAAYIDFLCRSACPPVGMGSNPQQSNNLQRHASRLVTTRMPRYSPPWNSLLALLAQPRSVVTTHWLYRNRTQAIFKYSQACKVLQSMDSIKLELDFKGFVELCKIVENAAVSARRALVGVPTAEKRAEMQYILDAGLSMVKARFAQIVQPIEELYQGQGTCAGPSIHSLRLERSGRSYAPILRLLEVPHPSELHAYVIFLGQYADYDGLLDLLRWISTFYDRLINEAKEYHNGMRSMRTCLTAIRVYVEQPLARSVTGGASSGGEAERHERAVERVNSVRKVFQSNEDLGGWPTDMEFEDYIERGEHNANTK